ncbi:Fructose-bisphosphate aldolase [Porphyridium purpureum]|uniref:fructose-bisphosphate aldolase n=1 Tax=Porphyridium purpureum TaxID=35688 RepID=A0A5J4YWN0_PORPP|nr:Fructose-bisphosphate aldolase [Porphyridium purpureum]|eukprot:POR1048..scf227_4
MDKYKDELVETALALCAPGRGILASDESTGTVGKRLEAVGLQNTADNRRDFRSLFYTAPGIGQYFAGAIMFHETLYQSTDGKGQEQTPFVDVLVKQQDMLPGIKMDRGLKPLPNAPGETFTEGLDGLADRARQYYEAGARFAKWRAVIKIEPQLGLPSERAIEECAHGLAMYAATCQAHGLMPMVEPEILIDGAHHIATSAHVAERVIHHVYASLHRYNVLLEATLLKPQMIMPGMSCETRSSSEEIAMFTLRTMRRVVPPAVPGIMFLSGGQSEEEATINLNTMNSLAHSGLREWRAPWSLSFSYGRALQSSVLSLWKGDPAKVEDAQRLAVEVARVNSLATLGKYQGPHPSQSRSSLVESFRGFRTGEDPTGT